MALIDRHYLARPYHGSRRMTAWLATQGHVINRTRVQRLIRLLGLAAIHPAPGYEQAGSGAQKLSLPTPRAGDRAGQSGVVLRRLCDVAGQRSEMGHGQFDFTARRPQPASASSLRLGTSGGSIGREMVPQVESVVDGGMDAEKPLCGAGRFEPLHFPLPPSHSLVRVLGAVVRAHPSLMTAVQTELPERGGIGGQLVGKRALRCKAVLLEQFAHQPHGGAFVRARLDQQIKDVALLVDGAP